MDMVAIGRVVLTNREHIIALEPLDNGLMGTLLRYPYEVRDEKEYFDEIQDVKVTKDMLDLAKHIVTQKTAEFEPEKFEDHYEEALVELINAKRNGKTVGQKPRPRGAQTARRKRRRPHGRAKEKFGDRGDDDQRQETPQGLFRSEGNVAADRRKARRREEGGKACARIGTPKGRVGRFAC